jgi:NADH:ubiquinone oxidoreductase subunit C
MIPVKGTSGLMVSPEKLTEVALALRDEIGFNYLSSVTGVDQ